MTLVHNTGKVDWAASYLVVGWPKSAGLVVRQGGKGMECSVQKEKGRQLPGPRRRS